MKKTGPKKRGRPPGTTAQGEETKERLYQTAVALMAERGYEATTLRAIAARAGVSHALLYRYFPSKSAVVLALYDSLSRSFAEGSCLGRGRWRARALQAIGASLDVLGPRRDVLRGATGILVASPDLGLFSPATTASRERVTQVFIDAIRGATDAPKPARADALGRLVYLLHLGVVLVWLLDRSKQQRATAGLLRISGPALRLAAAALRLPGAWRVIETADAVLGDALYPEVTLE